MEEKSMELSNELVSLTSDLDMEFEDALCAGKSVQKIEVGSKLESLLAGSKSDWDHMLKGYKVECNTALPDLEHRLVVA